MAPTHPPPPPQETQLTTALVASDNTVAQQPSSSKIMLNIVNPQITCSLCKGYLINATTIVECLHSCKYIFTQQSIYFYNLCNF